MSPDRALVETDAPHPCSARDCSTANEPADLGLVGAALAQVWGTTCDHVSEVTSALRGGCSAAGDPAAFTTIWAIPLAPALLSSHREGAIDMQIIIATDGHHNPETSAEMAGRLFETVDTVTLTTVIEVPRTLLTELRSFYRTPPPQASIDEDHEYVGQPTGGTLSPHWPGDDAMIARYVDDQTTKRLAPVKNALESRGITPVVVVRESDSPSSAVLELVGELNADVLIIGTHGRGRFEGLLGSTGTKLARLAPCSVILVR